MTNAFFIEGEAEGAIPNGARVYKVNSEPGDTHADGELGTVMSSIGPVEGHIGYFIEWDTHPGVPVFIVGHRLEVAA